MLKPCDGTPADYMRHRRRDEEPCKASKRAWADRQKVVRRRLRTMTVVEKRSRR